jgi:hypothetical protein
MSFAPRTDKISSEAEWLACTDPKLMLELLLGTTRIAIAMRVSTLDTWIESVNERKLRLYAVACFNRLRDLLPHPLARAAVEVAERAAEGLASPEDLARAHAEVRRAADDFEAEWRAARGAAYEAALPIHAALALALQVTLADAGWAAWYSSSNASWTVAASAHPGAALSDASFIATEAAEKKAQAALLRDIFGPLAFG